MTMTAMMAVTMMSLHVQAQNVGESGKNSKRSKFVASAGEKVDSVMSIADHEMLQEVTVKAHMPKTKLSGNSMITTIKGTTLAQSGSALEIFTL